MNLAPNDATISSKTLYRLGGLALLLGSLITFASMLLDLIIAGPLGYGGPSAAPVALLAVAGLILVVWGLLALYVKQAGRAGRLGLVGFLLLSGAVLLRLGHSLGDAVIIPNTTLSIQHPGAILALTISTALAGLIGAVLFGSAAIRAGVLPRGAGILLLFGPVTLLHAVPLPAVVQTIAGVATGTLLDVALAWFGYALLTERARQTTQLDDESRGALQHA